MVIHKVNDGLVRLDLSYNEISPKGVLVIAQALEDNDRLEVLRLDGNRRVCVCVCLCVSVCMP